MFYSYAPWLSLNRLIRPCKDVKKKKMPSAALSH